MTAKLTLADAIEIRVRVKRGERPADLAREKGVDPSTITAIVQRRSHNHHIAATLRYHRRFGKRDARMEPKESVRVLSEIADRYRPKGNA